MAAAAAGATAGGSAEAAAVGSGAQLSPNMIGNPSLYVGDLDATVDETQLYELFSQVSQVVSIRVCRDQNRRSSLGYAYVNYANAQEAAHAMGILNFTPINGKPIRIMYSHRDPSIRKSGYANVFIKNLDTSIDNKALNETFAAFGNVLSCKVAVDSNGQSRGYGFVQFENEESAQNAITRLNGMLINDKKVYVGLFVRRQERNQQNGSPKFTNVYVKNLAEATTDEDLKKLFGTYGTITSAVVMRDANGKSRCFGFVNFQSPDDAAVAVEKLNGSSTSDDKVLYVGRAQRKAEREAELKAKFQQERISRYEKLQGANLYLKNLDDNINDDKLKELFSEFGTITSCKVMLDPQGHSKGSGFVAFSTPEEATKALNEMSGKMIGRKPLFVAVASAKKIGRLSFRHVLLKYEHLVGWHLCLRDIILGHRDLPRNSCILVKPAGYGFQQQLLPGMRPGVAPNYIMPYHLQRQGQSGHRMGVRRGGNFQQLPQQQQLLHHNSNQGFRYMGNSRNGVDASGVPQGVVGPVMPLPFDAAPVDIQRPGPVHISTLSSALASASPENQRVMLGEHLYPHVENLEPHNASKVTGMLLEMDQSEVIHLLESPDALKQKVGEAMEVLRKAAATESGTFCSNTNTWWDGTFAFGISSWGTEICLATVVFWSRYSWPDAPQPAGYGFQQQLLPGMRPGVAPNYIMPYHLQRQGQSGHRMGVRRGGNFQQLPQQQQLLHHNSNQGFRYMGNSRNGVDASGVPQGVVGPVMPLPFDAAPVDIQRPGPVHISTLSSALASASPENQRVMLGEHLYPHVENLEPHNASKVTGMLLEMDQSEVIHLLESPDALKQKVGEAMEVLRKAAATESGVSDQLGSLALGTE
ncbi:polyadenylate-binding protein 3 [Quercus suber]|uniref:Polyadenylate-binding protein n=1 Tax=Quercus suber TaxID=58331 RepID=A0AAW0LBU6_QUESU